MTRILSLLLACFVALSACTPGSTPTYGSDGRPLPTVYKIRGNPEKLQFRMLDSVNALRQAQGLQAVQLNSQLNAAAATHAKDMARQNRPWHFGSTVHHQSIAPSGLAISARSWVRRFPKPMKPKPKHWPPGCRSPARVR